jgi:hypothetical protein
MRSRTLAALVLIALAPLSPRADDDHRDHVYNVLSSLRPEDTPERRQALTQLNQLLASQGALQVYSRKGKPRAFLQRFGLKQADQFSTIPWVLTQTPDPQSPAVEWESGDKLYPGFPPGIAPVKPGEVPGGNPG